MELEGIWSSVEKLEPLGFVVRTLIVGVMLYIAGRFLPNRSGGQYAGFDFTFFWMMGGLIASPLFDSKISFVNTITAAVTIYLMHYLISSIAVKSRSFARVVYGKAEVLVSGGQIKKKGMLKSLFPMAVNRESNGIPSGINKRPMSASNNDFVIADETKSCGVCVIYSLEKSASSRFCLYSLIGRSLESNLTKGSSASCNRFASSRLP